MNRFFTYVLLIVLILTSAYVFIYYLMADSIGELRTLPTSFLIAIVFYILAQLIKRFLQKKMPWYNWLYYLGLLAVIIPLPLFSVQGNWVFSLTRYGSLFLMLPPVIELVLLIRKK
ncbi:hypothetical protein CW751_11850 [Brumimicrobium salinarum]|uniref:Uncharacterized protein n=1 Tax=Brumimicrobium salinarum TaxID=2058658 RepID=A0A2I0R0E7_9FLAO|nr:hypothetical protein [Brumimicrobium salinarum]PKR80053.1 hypothetical protein CW751_11850 [Brumimicrobium salinarum]